MIAVAPKMEPPLTDKDHAQLFLNLYRSGASLRDPGWHYIEAWAVGILGRCHAAVDER